MKKVLALALLTTTLCGVSSADEQPAKAEFKTLNEKVSYAIGLQMGRDLGRLGVELNPQIIAAGMMDALKQAEPKMTQEEIEVAMQQFQKQIMLKQMPPELRAQAEANQKKGEEFLAKNAKREGVKTTASGLQYEIVKTGNGPKPTLENQVKTHYHGTLLDGTVFDSSVERKEPIEFPVGGVIQGWQEALQMMPVGSKWKIYVPSDLAYGMRGSGDKIGPNETLIFEVELLDITE